jgi:hypothetical protein
LAANVRAYYDDDDDVESDVDVPVPPKRPAKKSGKRQSSNAATQKRKVTDQVSTTKNVFSPSLTPLPNKLECLS